MTTEIEDVYLVVRNYEPNRMRYDIIRRGEWFMCAMTKWGAKRLIRKDQTRPPNRTVYTEPVQPLRRN